MQMSQVTTTCTKHHLFVTHPQNSEDTGKPKIINIILGGTPMALVAQWDSQRGAPEERSCPTSELDRATPFLTACWALRKQSPSHDTWSATCRATLRCKHENPL